MHFSCPTCLYPLNCFVAKFSYPTSLYPLNFFVANFFAENSSTSCTLFWGGEFIYPLEPFYCLPTDLFRKNMCLFTLFKHFSCPTSLYPLNFCVAKFSRPTSLYPLETGCQNKLGRPGSPLGCPSKCPTCLYPLNFSFPTGSYPLNFFLSNHFVPTKLSGLL